MSTFKELLGRVTPGKWENIPEDAPYAPKTLVFAAGRETVVASTWDGAANGQTKDEAAANAEYIARLNPETMKLVLAALETAQEVGEIRFRTCALSSDAADRILAALTALNRPTGDEKK